MLNVKSKTKEKSIKNKLHTVDIVPNGKINNKRDTHMSIEIEINNFSDNKGVN